MANGDELRKLDTEVAEKVIGWRTHSVSENVWYDPTTPNSIHKDNWQPSTDIAAAMEVVEKLYADGWEVQIQRSIVMDDDWSVELDRIADDWLVSKRVPVLRVSEIAKTLPEAICLAALRAVATKPVEVREAANT